MTLYILDTDTCSYIIRKNPGKVLADLQTLLFNKGTPISANDTMIAAHVLSLDATLVTNNTKYFSKVPLLNCINWLYSVEEAAPDSL